jgi:hypothetical protein
MKRLLFLKFKILQETNINSPELVKKIHLELEKENYQIVHESDDSIGFTYYENKTQLVSKSKYAKTVPLGVFKIDSKEGKSYLKLVYCVSIVTEEILFLALLVCGFFISYAILIFVLILAFRLMTKINKLKQVGKKLIMDIIN